MVYAFFEDGSEGDLLRYYAGELSFAKDELIGLTRAAAYRLLFEQGRSHPRT
jgi:hypothetical protein